MAPADAETFSYPHKTSSYSYRVPTPPRIVVPPPALNDDALPDITLSALQSAPFLNAVNYSNLVSSNAVLEWSYECRRKAQMILPYLFLGPMTAAKDEMFLRNGAELIGDGKVGGGIKRTPLNGAVAHGRVKHNIEGGITMVLGIRQKHCFESKLMHGALRIPQSMGIVCETVDLASNQDLIHQFPQTTALINAHLAQYYTLHNRLGKVLVVCESGNERSAGVVAAYLMETHMDVDFIKAMQLVQAQRFCANFDDAMKRLLQGYWDLVCAKRQVAATTHEVGGGGGDMIAGVVGKAKRRLQRDEEDELMGGVDEDDVERFGGRSFAPFMDQSL
ncbi:hypothetical protein LTR62_003315 [Meristemomyces frigidus]|uniref:Tyrosine specific protein phosphatases domain-containing protein n=1 Tax=Meristemomyces frigidus TaxID=1508187 RepID=A0AAN7YH31_9PEZI|nr:hypothetical protein LTR62_003315 [Meristemomyces frigidus]